MFAASTSSNLTARSWTITARAYRVDPRRAQLGEILGHLHEGDRVEIGSGLAARVVHDERRLRLLRSKLAGRVGRERELQVVHGRRAIGLGSLSLAGRGEADPVDLERDG